MSRPAVFSVMEYLEAVCPTLPAPTPQLEWLEPDGLSVALIQTTEPKVVKTYINGSTECRLAFDIVAQGKTTDRLNILTYLFKYMRLFEVMDNLEAGTITIKRAETTTPSLRAQTEDLTVRYAISVTINYKE